MLRGVPFFEEIITRRTQTCSFNNNQEVVDKYMCIGVWYFLIVFKDTGAVSKDIYLRQTNSGAYFQYTQENLLKGPILSIVSKQVFDKYATFKSSSLPCLRLKDTCLRQNLGHWIAVVLQYQTSVRITTYLVVHYSMLREVQQTM